MIRRSSSPPGLSLSRSFFVCAGSYEVVCSLQPLNGTCIKASIGSSLARPTSDAARWASPCQVSTACETQGPFAARELLPPRQPPAAAKHALSGGAFEASQLYSVGTAWLNLNRAKPSVSRFYRLSRKSTTSNSNPLASTTCPGRRASV